MSDQELLEEVKDEFLSEHFSPEYKAFKAVAKLILENIGLTEGEVKTWNDYDFIRLQQVVNKQVAKTMGEKQQTEPDYLLGYR